ncbi:UDP-N-acetylmuramoylalanine--D-glutamate ligase [PVC group bacterium (ex Bugula neritina AB1)]|nr:UDP-N-acetylmuramoylalanine--D-glutamate ligase [PVC group bacterium (ex Bugula neritina AB1)]
MGLGKSGKAVERWCLENDIDFLTYDDSCSADYTPKNIENLPWKNIRSVVLAPGVALSHRVVNEAKKRDIDCIGEIEFALNQRPEVFSKVIAVTGTNGKTTLVNIIYNILRSLGEVAHLLGNVGTPLTEKLAKIQKGDYIVLELSSFQLDSLYSLRSRVSVILNITPDHSDRYDTFNDYVKSKVKITQNQKQKDFCLLPEDFHDRGYCLEGSPHVIYADWALGKNRFSKSDGSIFHDGKHWMFWKDICLIGDHNKGNILTALTALESLGVDVHQKCVKIALQNFLPLPHRLEKVETLKGVTYINDSKATNLDAVLKAIESFETSIILIFGGKPKSSDVEREIYTEILPLVATVIVYGEAAHYVSLKKTETKKIHLVELLPEAVLKARLLAKKGDTVLFSPGCSSFDLYMNYKERGEAFKKAVLLQ